MRSDAHAGAERPSGVPPVMSLAPPVQWTWLKPSKNTETIDYFLDAKNPTPAHIHIDRAGAGSSGIVHILKSATGIHQLLL